MTFGTLILSGWNWVWLAVGIILLGLGLSVWSYRGAGSGWLKWVCLTLKTLGVAALAMCLLEPLWSGQRARPGANLFAIVADNSQGLQIKDRDATRSRGELLRDLLSSRREDWQASLEE